MPSSRRRFLERSGLVLSGLALAGASAESIVADTGRFDADTDESGAGSTHDWPMARYDPAGTGHQPAATGPKDGVEIAWAHDPPEWFRGTTSPVLLDGTIYAVGDGLLALDAETGAKRFGVPGPYRSTPARARASVYTTETLATTAPTGVFGLNAGGGVDVPLRERNVGIERWGGPRGPGGGLLGPGEPTTPVAAGGTVYVPIPGTNSVAAVDPNDGSVRWRQTHHADSPISGPYNRPAVADGAVFVTAWPHQATAYDAETGSQRWHREIDDQMVLPPVATDEGIVVPTRESVHLLDAGDGHTIWKRNLDANVTESAPAVADGTVFVVDELASIYALDLATGETLWTAPFDGKTSPVVADGVVYAVRSQFELVAVDAATGEKRFAYEPDQIPLSTLVVGDGVLYAANRERVIALREEG
ncbi:Outer membrane protein assembly factor BamB, contains PQQ-like beta-propeller repeat [Halomicrobium zhouii]|uniref:Outer membrane protein assembly factor BamB, contains PQQ-like beta-propeller repeat n=1 Tax=Halomicrobium zhouii TaxID=767519 RepID=A0A1I6L075_9EURY|nr:PQQ-binding-like beta-propeller repeat protein [Halomicrobium zhouii]SFR96590.1 Outer membrane protein assembly factor BamB, contains PQQ-like beta-propeller repeat [Halomicrobium zhouii]